MGNQAILSLETLHFQRRWHNGGAVRRLDLVRRITRKQWVKKTAIGSKKGLNILADYSKFGNISSVTFEEFAKAQIITDRKPPEAFLRSKNIIVA